MSTLKLFLLVLIGTQILFYAAREPIQRMLRSLGASVAGALRLLSRTCVHKAQSIRARAAGRLLWLTEQRARDQIEHELVCLEETLPTDLNRYAQLITRLRGLVAALEADTRFAAPRRERDPTAGEEPTSWSGPPEEVVARLREAALDGDVDTLDSFRLQAESRQRILRAMGPKWREIRATSEELEAIVLRTLGSTERVEEHTEMWARARRDDPELMRRAQHAARVAFVVPLVLFGVVLAAIGLNVALLYPAVRTVFVGVDVLGVDAAVPLTALVQLLQCAAGVWVAESLGATRLFPSARRATNRRPRLVISASVLLVVASVQACIVLLAGAVDPTFVSALEGPRDELLVWVPLVGRTVVAWALPWTLTMVALPIEHSARASGSLFGGVGIAGSLAFAHALRVASHGARYVFRAAAHLYDAYIAIPLGLERRLRRRRIAPSPPGPPPPATDPVLAEAESSGERTVRSRR